MKLHSMKIYNFRNISSAEFEFSDINTFIGNNAQGKTNLMEAISVCMGKSFRKSSPSEITPMETSKTTTINLRYSSDLIPEKINEIIYEIKEGKVSTKINGIDIKKAKELYNSLEYVVFVPDDLFMIKGNPDLRRDYADEVANSMNKIHHERLADYKKALKQKNVFISNLPEKLTDNQKLQLEIWNENLARLGVNVMCGRVKYLKTLSKYATEYYKQLNNNDENLTIKYESSIVDEEFDEKNVELMLNSYLEKLKEALPKELILKHTMVGVHRDDISFLINGQDAKTFASQGQIRSIALALRMAQAQMLKEKWDDEPIVILDDVMSELDGYRRSFILKQNVTSQLFITGCNEKDFDFVEETARWRVEKGSFTKIHS